MIEFLAWLVVVLLAGILFKLDKLIRLAGQSAHHNEETAAYLGDIQDELEGIKARLAKK